MTVTPFSRSKFGIACEVAAHLDGYSTDAHRIATLWAIASIKNGADPQSAIRAAVATARFRELLDRRLMKGNAQ